MFHAGPCASETRSRAEASPAVRNNSGPELPRAPQGLASGHPHPGGSAWESGHRRAALTSDAGGWVAGSRVLLPGQQPGLGLARRGSTDQGEETPRSFQHLETRR